MPSLTRVATVLLLAAVAACAPPGAAVRPSLTAPHAPDEPDMQVITSAQAAGAGLSGEEMTMTFADDADGTAMLSAWLERARRRGSSRVGDVVLYVVRKREADSVECRSAFYPEDTVEPVFVPGETRRVMVSRPVTRAVTQYENRCRLVSKPVQRSETSYQSQYDFMSKSYRTVPVTRMVTKYEMVNECRSEPVTRYQTTWEFATELRYSPPRTEYLAAKRLRETAPECYAVEGEPKPSRVEGKVYLRR